MTGSSPIRMDDTSKSFLEIPIDRWKEYPTQCGLLMHQFITDYLAWDVAIDIEAGGCIRITASAPVEPVHHFENLP